MTEQVVELIGAAVMDTPDRPLYLCGESFGGCLAISVALHSPELFNRIILINPASAFNRRPWLGLGGPLTGLLPTPLYQLSTLGLLPWLANLERITSGDRQALLEAMQSVPQKTSVWRLSLLGEFRLPETQLNKLTQPVLLIASAADRLLPSSAEVQTLATYLPDSKIHILPNSGHACLLETDVNLHEILKEHDFLIDQPLVEEPCSHR
jgi:pimeloyl-ACP methyl ester carboxylesterase